MKLIGVLTAIMVLVGGCALQPDLSDKSTETGRLASQAVDEPPNATLDELFAQVESQVPGFGGLFFDEQDKINIYLTNPIEAGSAKSTIATVFSSHRPKLAKRVVQSDVKILQGEYSFSKLRQWKSEASELVSNPAVTMIDANERRNRVTIGVYPLTKAPEVSADLEDLNIPENAVLIEEFRPVKPLSHSLDDHVRPLKGGLAADYAPGICTMGFLAVRDGVDGFVVNSHCTQDQGGVESTDYFQNNENNLSHHVGVETADPTYSTGGSCPSGKKYRASDSAFVDLDSDTSYSIGYIYRTTGLGSRNISHISPEFRITDTVGFPMGGETLNKVGITTGWTQGSVTNTCVNMNQTGTNFHLFCQDVVSAGIGPGNSGSPVFELTHNPQSNDVALYGLAWGGNSSEFVLSSLSNIEGSSELGGMWQCASGFSC